MNEETGNFKVKQEGILLSSEKLDFTFLKLEIVKCVNKLIKPMLLDNFYNYFKEDSKSKNENLNILLEQLNDNKLNEIINVEILELHKERLM